MIPQIDKFLKKLETKPNWGSKELIQEVNGMGQSISQQLKNEGKAVVVDSSKKTKVGMIKKYDILYLPLVGIPHYFLVHQVIENTVYGVIFSSKNKASHTIHEIQYDRFFIGSYATTSYLSCDLDESLDSFVRVYESKKEADLIFKKIKEYYKNILKIK